MHAPKSSLHKSVRFAEDLVPHTSKNSELDNKNNENIKTSKASFDSRNQNNIVIKTPNKIIPEKDAYRNYALRIEQDVNNIIKNNKSSPPNKAIDDPLIESLNNQIQEVLTKLDHKITKSYENKESKSKSSKIMTNNTSKQEGNNSSNSTKEADPLESKYSKDIETMQKEIDELRRQSNYYSSKLLESEKKITMLKSHANYLDYELKQEHKLLLNELREKKKLESAIESIYSLTERSIGEIDPKDSINRSPNSINQKKYLLNDSAIVMIDDSTDINDNNQQKQNLNDMDGILDKSITQSSPNELIKNTKITNKSIESRYSIKNVNVTLIQEHIKKILNLYMTNQEIISEIIDKIVLFIENSLNAKNQEISKLSKIIEKLYKEKSKIVKNHNNMFNNSNNNNNSNNQTLDINPQYLAKSKEDISSIFVDCLEEYQNSLEDNIATKMNSPPNGIVGDGDGGNGNGNGNGGGGGNGIISENTDRQNPLDEEMLNRTSSKKRSTLTNITKIKIMESLFNNPKVNEILENINQYHPKFVFRNMDTSVGINNFENLYNRDIIKHQFNDENKGYEQHQYEQNIKNLLVPINPSMQRTPRALRTIPAIPKQEYQMEFNATDYKNTAKFQFGNNNNNQLGLQTAMFLPAKIPKGIPRILGGYSAQIKPLSFSPKAKTAQNSSDTMNVLTNKRIQQQQNLTATLTTPTHRSQLNKSLDSINIIDDHVSNEGHLKAPRRIQNILMYGKLRPDSKKIPNNMLRPGQISDFQLIPPLIKEDRPSEDSAIKFTKEFAKKIVVNRGKLMVLKP